jgi:hypothetical protein
MLFWLALFSLLPGLRAAEGPEVLAARTAVQRAVAYLQSIATGGGYLWRYSLDLKARAGEVAATDSQIWIQPPGTPSVGMVLLEAYSATGDGACLEAARGVARALAAGQLESGGWAYMVEFDPEKARRWYRRRDIGHLSPEEIRRRQNVSTYDDNTTQSGLMFLMDYVAVAPSDAAAREALDYGLRKLLEAQYPIGAWPQRYAGTPGDEREFPVLSASLPRSYPRRYEKRSYSAHYTLNDNAQRDVMGVMLRAWRQFGDDRYRDAAVRGGEFLLRAQLPEPQPVWAQQYNARMEPDWARSFEPAAVCGGESVGAMRTLLDLYVELGDERYLEPIPRALRWYERSEIRPGVWNRYYELHTNRPIFGDRDGEIHYSLDDISEERRKGYGWQGGYGLEGFRRDYEKLLNRGREKILAARQPRELSAGEKARRMESMVGRVRKIVAAQDARGRWVTRGYLKHRDYEFSERVETRVFVENLRVLAEYLALAR